MRDHLPGDADLTALPPLQDVVVQLFSHRTITEPIRVPAVVEPLLVLVLAGTARVEERVLDGPWSAATVRAGDFYLTDTQEPYEMRWQTLEGDSFEVMHLYLGLPFIEQAARELLGPQSTAVALLDVSGARDETVHWLMESMRRELLDQRTPSLLCLRGLAQTLAVHLLRHYRAPQGVIRRSNALQAYKLRKVIDAMNAQLADEFSLTRLARTAELSEYHFSRMFKRATGFSPSQYFIGLRMARARQLLIETQRSVIDIGLEVGYSSPSHFSQVFRREVGVTPSAYRQA
ncbi:AraC family transcriptional regulator [Stutzerimonas decontaminans]|uniref:AraC family transcriptional regulator n=2 Tax=Stutzerimonas TaxID=2901164 RepID=A0ABX4VS61_9GAMM|nr:AraC family transcriptional regulator [Stutzerimonas decontaminans]AHY42905.1 AraC family transcriptional regulator [Stutzerimonas decontaminans]MCQ4244146.1 AraC family transcriptional regulator [Stutzerimonas decontaminans]PNF83012.1 AraC family transcriptional regulator [Stutzerimonas decontaminans]